VYVEIGPLDADYSRLAAQALTPEEAERRRDRWQAEDEALRQEFLEFARRNGESAWPDAGDGEQF
jgi:post-segregation antitoxin (ccd killing protein)